MLKSLYIQNYALIEKLDITFDTGFSVITGETGAGKSIMLGAIGLLLGQRADTKSIRQGASKCVIEARFDVSGYAMQPLFEENELDYDDECVFRREIYSSGKSRAFINDTPVSLTQIRELGELLIDIHSQHQNLLLNKEDFQLDVLDILAMNGAMLDHYHALYCQWKQAGRELATLVEEAGRSRADEEYLRFQLSRLDEAALSPDEQEELEQEAGTLAHAEEIKAGLYKAEQLLSADDTGLLSSLRESLNALLSVQKIYQPAGELAGRIESTYIELKDIARETAARIEKIEFNPQRMEEVNDRLNLIYSLQQKHRVQTVEQLLALAGEYRSRLEEITSYDEQIAALTTRRDKLYEEVTKKAAALTERRKDIARDMEKEVVARLVPLGMPHVNFKVQLGTRNEPGAKGADTVAFLFSANKNGALQTISSVASGGETARVMLSVKAMIAGTVKLPTIIFDEIDTGVSGEIADRMADIMQEMGDRNRQVISITHLPQIAARGKKQYLVYKQDNDNETNSHIRELTAEERTKEIARMLSGAILTEAALNNARELLKKQ